MRKSNKYINCICIIVFYMINCYLTFLLIDYHINNSSLYVLTLISTTFLAAFISTLIIKVKYYHWVISLVILCIIILTFKLRPIDGLYAVALYVQFETIFISESVGFVLAKLINNAGRYTIHNPNDDHSLSLNNGWLKTAAEKTAKYVESFNCDNTELVHSLSEFANKNNKNELSQQINDAVVFIDGAITRYELEDIPTSEHCNKESRELDFYCCYPKYLVKTDTNKEYSFTFCYHCLWTKHEDCTGIGSIRIEDKASGESIAIGYFEYPYGDY